MEDRILIISIPYLEREKESISSCSEFLHKIQARIFPYGETAEAIL